MNIEVLQNYCLSKKGTTAEFPFDEHTLVFKVMNKMFALVGLEKWESGNQFINLKCEPDKALELRDEFPDDIYGAYHMSKKHWNSVNVNSNVPTKRLITLIDYSYDLVVANLTKKQKETLNNLDS